MWWNAANAHYSTDWMGAVVVVAPPLLGFGHIGALLLLLLLVLALVVIATLLLFLLRYLQTYRDLVKAGLPTVFWRPRFVTYDTKQQQQLPSSNITNILPRMQKLQGPYGMYGTVYGTAKVVHVAHPLVAQILLGASSKHRPLSSSSSKPPMGTTKAPAYDHFKNFCGEGVFTAEGGDWKRKRTAVLHALVRNHTAFFETVSHQANECFQQQLREELDSVVDCPVNIVPVLQRATVGLIYRYITHQDLPCSQQKQQEQESQSQTTPNLLTLYLASITRIRMIILAQSRSIWFLLPRWCYERLSSMYQDENQTMIPIRALARLACDSARPNSPLDQLKQLDLYKQTPKNLLDEAITLLFAGQDTSAATLSWTLHLLTLYPHVQAKLADEVCRVMGDKEDDNNDDCRPLTKQSLSKMPYLDAVIKESMRLYPVAPFVVRKLDQHVPLPPNDDRSSQAISLPKGALACIWIYSLHRHPDFWKDPHAFQPERWLADTRTKELGLSTPGAYLPFAAGPRSCVGQPLAHIILRTLLARMVHRYQFVDDHVQPGVTPLRKDMQAGFTVLPEGGLFLSVQRRKKNVN